MNEKTNIETIRDSTAKVVKMTGIWMVDFKESINLLLKSRGLSEINFSDLKSMSYNNALEQYGYIINEWHPLDTLDVFWINGFKNSSNYQNIPYQLKKELYEKFGTDLIEAIFNDKTTSSSQKMVENNVKNVLFELALNKKLTYDDYVLFEDKQVVKNYATKSVNFIFFTKLFKIGEVYNRQKVWESYLDRFREDQYFLNKVKVLFSKEKSDYVFEEKELSLFKKNSYGKELQIDPNMLYKYNSGVSKATIEMFLTGLNNWLHELAKGIENTAVMKIDKKNSSDFIVTMIFEKNQSLIEYDMLINRFERYYKSIIQSVVVDKDKQPSVYVSELIKTANYYYLEEKIVKKNDGKKVNQPKI